MERPGLWLSKYNTPTEYKSSSYYPLPFVFPSLPLSLFFFYFLKYLYNDMGHKNDYRVSTLIVLCKDCGQDVGLYPARHQCTSNKRPQLPTLCSSTTSSFKSWNQEEELAVPDLVATTPTVTRQASDSSMESGKWSFFRSDVRKQQSSKPKDEDKSVYFDTYASHLKNSTSLSDMNDSTTNGKKLWGKMKENEKWKDLVAEKSKIFLLLQPIMICVLILVL